MRENSNLFGIQKTQVSLELLNQSKQEILDTAAINNNFRNENFLSIVRLITGET